MNKKDETTSTTQQFEADLRSNASPDMVTFIPIPSNHESDMGDHTSELYNHCMVKWLTKRNGKPEIEVLDLETEKWVRYKFPRNVHEIRFDYHTCRKAKNEIVVYGGLKDYKEEYHRYNEDDDYYEENKDITVLRLSEDNEFVKIETFKPKNKIDVKDDYSLHFFNDKLYLLSEGSWRDPGTQNELFSFNFTSLTWTKCKMTTNLPPEVIRNNTVLYKGRIYVLGGMHGKQGERYSSGFYELDLTADNFEWKKIAYSGSLPRPREQACMIAAEEGKIYVFGGQEFRGFQSYKDLFEYDISSGIWREIKINRDLTSFGEFTGAFYKGTLFIAGSFKDEKDNKKYEAAKIKLVDEKSIQFKLQLENLDIDPQSSDVLFKVHDQTFPAHKAVLSVRCQFFKNMFESGMMEANNSEILIQDIEPSSFKGVLDYIYSNKVEFTVGLAKDLLKLSDKWFLHDLKSECEDFLSKKLTSDNFKDVAALTEHVEVPKLANAIIDFALEHAKTTKQRSSLQGLPQELYINLLERFLDFKFTS